MRTSKVEQTPRVYAHINWEKFFIIAGTVSGAAILLLINYYKNKRLEEGNPDDSQHLEALVREAKGGHDETAVLLETGSAVREYIQDSAMLAAELAEGLPEEIDHVAEKGLPKKRGNFKDTMRTLARLIK